MSDAFELEICQGKYRYRYEAGKQEVWRNGDIWPAMNGKLIGDKFVFSLAVELDEALKECNSLRADKATLQQMAYSLKDRLEAAEKERDATMRLADSLALALNTSNHERDTLRAKIAEMEQQKPVAFALYSGWALKAAYRKEHEACDQRDRRQLSADLGGSLEAYRVVPLYALPGAQGEEE